MRNLVSAFTQDAFQIASTEKQIALVEVTHDDWVEPVRVADTSDETLTSNGVVYAGRYPFTIFFPGDKEDGASTGKIIITNLDPEQYISTNLNAILTAPIVNLKLVMKSDPNTVVLALNNYKLTDIEINEINITGNISKGGTEHEVSPRRLFNPTQYPGCFRGSA